MTKKKSFELKAPLMAVGLILVVALLGILYVSTNNEFKVMHNEEIPQTVGADGRYVAGSEEFYHIEPSPSIAWELGAKPVPIIIGFCVIGLLAVFFIVVHKGFIRFEGPAPSRISWVGCGLAFALLFGGYVSGFTANSVKITPEKYEQVKGDKSKMEQLFRDKDFLK